MRANLNKKQRCHEARLSGRISSRPHLKVDGRCLHRDRDFAAQALRLKDEPRFASELGRDASFDQLSSETMLLGLNDTRSALLDPLDLQAELAVFCTSRPPL